MALASPVLKGGSMRTSLFSLASALAAVVTVANCACDAGVVFVDSFGDGAVDGDRLHTYAAGSRVELALRGDGITSDVEVESSDPRVFAIASATRRDVPAFFGPDARVLHVALMSSDAGEAELIVKSGAGDVVDQRTLRFVDVDNIALTRVVGLPGEVEGPIDLAALAVGERGADFLLSYTAESEGDVDVHGLDVVGFDNATLARVEVQTIDDDFVPTARNFVHIAAVPEPTSFFYVLGGVRKDAPLVAVPGVAADVDFVRKSELRELIAGRDVPPEVVALLAAGSDERVVCDDNDTCAAKLEPKDTEGRVVFGAPVTWQVGDGEAQEGDIVSFARGDQEHTLTARLGDFTETLTVRAEPDSFSVFSSTQAVSCAAIGEGGLAVSLVGLVGLRRRRRR